jgi:hypothetical protein
MGVSIAVRAAPVVITPAAAVPAVTATPAVVAIVAISVAVAMAVINEADLRQFEAGAP